MAGYELEAGLHKEYNPKAERMKGKLREAGDGKQMQKLCVDHAGASPWQHSPECFHFAVQNTSEQTTPKDL